MTTNKAYEVVGDLRKMTYDQWLQARLNSIGGSEAAAACGLSRWKSQLELFCEKRGLVKHEKKDAASEERMHFGKILEPIIRKEFGIRIGHEVKELPYMLRSKAYPWMHSNIDGYFLNENGVNLVEIKTTSSYGESEWTGDSDCPPEYLVQCAHYMACLGSCIKRCYLVALIGGNHLVWKVIERDDELINNVIILEKQFWSHVQNGIAPKVKAKDSDFLSSIYPRSTAKVATLPPEAADWIKDYQTATKAMDIAKTAKEAAEAKIKAALKDADTAMVGGYKVSWKSSTSNRLNGDKVKAILTSEQLKSCTTSTTSRRFVISQVKTKK
jgi:putative phage-type endonuclease